MVDPTLWDKVLMRIIIVVKMIIVVSLILHFVTSLGEKGPYVRKNSIYRLIVTFRNEAYDSILYQIL